jgi:hypothetical protein
MAPWIGKHPLKKYWQAKHYCLLITLRDPSKGATMPSFVGIARKKWIQASHNQSGRITSSSSRGHFGITIL